MITISRIGVLVTETYDKGERDHQRSPLVGCSSQNLLASSAFAGATAPTRTDRAIRADKMVFMAVTPGRCRQHRRCLSSMEQEDGSFSGEPLSRLGQFPKSIQSLAARNPSPEKGTSPICRQPDEGTEQQTDRLRHSPSCSPYDSTHGADT